MVGSCVALEGSLVTFLGLGSNLSEAKFGDRNVSIQSKSLDRAGHGDLHEQVYQRLLTK